MTDVPIQQRPGPNAVGSTEEQPGTVATAAHETAAHAGELAHDAMGEARGVADTAKHQARSLASGARQQLAREADDATGRAAKALATTADDLDAMASGRGAPGSPAADVVAEIGQRAQRMADQLRDRGYQGVVDDVSRWARSHPGAFLLAAAGTGFAVGRLFRSVDTGAVMEAARDGAGLNGSDEPTFNGPAPVAPELLGADVPPVAGQIGATTAGAGAAQGMTPSTASGPAQIDLTDDPAWREADAPTSTGGLPPEVRP